MIKNIRSFLSTESSKDALRNILAIVLPALTIHLYYDTVVAIAFAVGVILSSLTDLPGNRQDKTQTAIWCIPIFCVTALTISLCLFNKSWFILPLLGILGFAYTIISLFGVRIGVVGNLGLIVASFTIGLRPHDPFIYTLSLTAGTTFFFLVCIIQVYFSPYRSLNYAIQDGITNMSNLLRYKINCYDENQNLSETYKHLSVLHIKVSDQLEAIRSILLRDKHLLAPNDEKTRQWLSKLYYLVDLYELLTAVDNDYETIRHLLKETQALPLIRIGLSHLADETNLLSDSASAFGKPQRREEILALISQLENIAQSSPGNQKVLIHSIAEHIQHILTILTHIRLRHEYANESWLDSKSYKDFVAPKANFEVIRNNLNLKSPIFLYAVRMSALLFLGGTIGYFLPEFRYASWILLTIIIVARPTYHITQKRNYQRIVGSLIGLFISLFLLFTIQSTIALLILSLISLYVYFLFVKPNYLICAIFVTVSIVLFQYIYEGHSETILGSRFAFTLLGSLFAILGCLAIPINHYRSIERSTDALLHNFNLYLDKIQENIRTTNINFYDLRLLRKSSQTSLAQCFDSLVQLEKEPKLGKIYSKEIHQFQALAYRIHALLVGLAVNLTKSKDNFEEKHFDNKVQQIHRLVEEAKEISNNIAHNKSH